MTTRVAATRDRHHLITTARSQLAALTGLSLDLMPEEPIQIGAENAVVLDEQTGAYAGLVWDADRGVVNMMWLYPDGIGVALSKALVGAALDRRIEEVEVTLKSPETIRVTLGAPALGLGRLTARALRDSRVSQAE